MSSAPKYARPVDVTTTWDVPVNSEAKFTWFSTMRLFVVGIAAAVDVAAVPLRTIPLSGGGGAITPLPLAVTTLPRTWFVLEFLSLIPTSSVTAPSPPELSWTVFEPT